MESQGVRSVTPVLMPANFKTLKPSARRALSIYSNDPNSSVIIRPAMAAPCYWSGRLRPFFQQRLPPHNVIDRLRDVGGVVAYALYVLGAEQQMCTEPDIAWILHHIGEELAEQRILHRIDLLISAPHLESFR